MLDYSLVGNDVYTDIEMFEAYTSEHSDSTILNQIGAYAPNESCMRSMEDLLRKPIVNTSELVNRQNRVRNILDKYSSHREKTDSLICKIKETEEDVQWLLGNDTTKHDILNPADFVYVKWRVLKQLGCNASGLFLLLKNAYIIMLSPMLSIFSPIVSIIIPYVILRFKLKLKIPFTVFLRTVLKIIISNVTWMIRSKHPNFMQLLTYVVSIIIYFQAIFNTVELSKNTYKVVRFISHKMTSLSNYIKACGDLLRIYGIDDNAPEGCKTSGLRLGEKMVLYKQIRSPETAVDHERHTHLREYIRHTNHHLAFVGIALLANARKMCFTNFVEGVHEPILSTKGLYHASVENPVPNDFDLRSENCVITGPNAAGKSTLIKALLINTIVSQTFGLAFATEFEMTPFYFITSQINIPDVKGKESLFEAEMYRSKFNLDIVKQVPSDRKCLVVMDEMFNTTNVVEGVSGAYGILRNLCKSSNACTIVTTHYSILAKTKGVKACQMEVDQDTGASIRFPYILTDGISKQFVAIELLKNHFDEDVIECAINFKKKLLLV